MSAGTEGGPESQPLTSVDRVIHEPARLMILVHLYVVESGDFIFLMRQTGLTRGNLSSHMSRLEAAGYVTVHKEFVDRIPRTLYRLTNEGRRAFQVYRNAMKKALEELPG
jgi:DNA-binding MarR family transcriptional regulator